MQPDECPSLETLRDAYLSVELKTSALEPLSAGLVEELSRAGIEASLPTKSPHVTIAYGEGLIAEASLVLAMHKIARRGFSVEATGFEILKGQTTDFDYLVLTLESRGDFSSARDIVEGHMSTRQFAEAFRAHVSLVRIPKSPQARAVVERVVRELNASHGAAHSLGRCLCIEGDCVAAVVAGDDSRREVCLQVPIAFAA